MPLETNARRRWRNRLLALAGSCFVLWAIGNLVVVNLATAALQCSAAERLGVTDGKGVLVVERVVQEQPLWMWPRIGWFRFHGLAIVVSADGYAAKTIELVDLLPAMSMTDPVGRVRVPMQRP